MSFSSLMTFSKDLIFDQCACGVYPLQNTTYPLKTVHIELTTECNNHCAGCGNIFDYYKADADDQRKIERLSISEWKKILSKLPSSIDHINITGGEPTLHPFFDKFVQMIDDFNLTWAIFTNGRWLEPDSIITQLGQMRGHTGLLVSLHGNDVAAHESFTLTNGSFHETIKNIQLAVNAGLTVSLSSIINRFNYNQSRDIVRLGRKLGVKQVVFSRYVGTPSDRCAPNQEQIKYALREIESIRISGAPVKLSVSIPQCFYFSCALGCGAGVSYITIDPWGNVRPCNYSPLVGGNILFDSLDSILNSEQFKMWRNFVPKACRGCSAFLICRGGCKAEAMRNHQSKDTLMNSPFESSAKFTMVSEHLRPVTAGSLSDFSQEITEDALKILTAALNEGVTLKEIGMKHGQEMLDFIGSMHHHGMIEFKEPNA